MTPLWVTDNVQFIEQLHTNPLRNTHHTFSFLVLSNNMIVLPEQEGQNTFYSSKYSMIKKTGLDFIYSSYYFLNIYDFMITVIHLNPGTLHLLALNA